MSKLDYTSSPLAQLESPDGGAALKSMMEERGITIAELCRRTGLSRNTVRRLRAGESGNLATWREIARALGCRIDDIAG